MTGDQDHYFSPRPRGPVNRRTIDVHLAGRDGTVEVASGVFSPGHVDLGTRVLLRSVPDVPDDARNVLDLGCGWGPLALTMAAQAPHARVWAVDANELALELTEANAERWELPNVTPAVPDKVPPNIQFEAIWSNPPIRVGQKMLHAMMLRWLPRLSPGGAAYLVVQRNLGSDSLHRWLAEELPPVLPGATITRLASAKGFRVLEVRLVGISNISG